MNLKNIDLGKIATFKLLVKEASFSKASKESGISYSSLAHDMATLEKGLEVTLFHRTKRKFIPTKEGLELLKIFEETIQKLNSMSGYDTKTENFETLTVHSSVTLNHFFVIETIKELNKKYPTTNFRLFSGPEYTRKIDIDVDIIIGNPIRNRSDLSVRELFLSQYGFFASEGYLENFSEPKSIRDLKNHNLLIYSGDHFLDENVVSKNKVIITSNSYLTLLQCCYKSLGILSFPVEIMAIIQKENPTKYQSVRRILPDAFPEEDQICLSYKRFSDKHLIILDFYEIIKMKFDKLNGEYHERDISLHSK